MHGGWFISNFKCVGFPGDFFHNASFACVVVSPASAEHQRGLTLDCLMVVDWLVFAGAQVEHKQQS
jgi:hypothetical protein